jgi:hypothetical protein
MIGLSRMRPRHISLHGYDRSEIPAGAETARPAAREFYQPLERLTGNPNRASMMLITRDSLA